MTQYPKLILPKPHLSYTQWHLWISNPTRYMKEYFENGDKLDTRFLRFGKGMAQLVEDLCKIMFTTPDRAQAIENLAIDNPMSENMKVVLMNLEIEGISEYKIECKVKHIIPCLSYIDKYLERLNCFREYKSGKGAWTKSKVQKHEQLVFYATTLKWSGKPVPEYCDLDWVETAEEQQESVDFWRQGGKILDVTGRIVSFHREFDEREIERMENLIEKVAWEISDAYQNYLSEL